jgi:hypothetical protein
MHRVSRWRAICLIATGLTACASGAEPDPGPVAAVVAGSRLHRDPVAPFQGSQDLDPKGLFPTLTRTIGAPFDKLGMTDFEVRLESDVPTPSGRRLTYVSMRQTIDGVPIVGTHLNLTVQPDTGVSRAKLLSSSYRVYDVTGLDTTPALDRDQAIEKARAKLGVGSDVEATLGELVIRSLDDHLRLVWDVKLAGRYERAVVLAGGADAGSVVVIDDRVYADGVVNGFYAHGAPPGQGGVTSDGLANLTLTGGTATASTNADGAFNLDVADGTTVNGSLAGRAVTVQNNAGANLSVSGPGASGMTLTFGSAGANEQTIALVTTYYWTDAVRTFADENGIGANLGGAIPANVNIASTCNAYYTPGSPSINFFRSGGGCRNSASDSVIAHEYGHFVDDMFGGILDGGLSEGWGDVLACLLLRQPIVGEGFLDDGTPIRTCDNDYVYPQGGGDEVHNLGQAWAGFAWHAREGLIEALGEEQGDALARQLILPSFASNAADIPDAVRETFQRDDDDGDLANQTPHWDILFAAADRHGLAFAVDPDGGGGGGGTCGHDKCVTGGPLSTTACDDPCVAQICAADSFCCTTSWDQQCVNEVASICGESCDGGPSCGDGACDGGETCMTCPSDCGECPPACGNGVCEAGETCETCAADCGECPPACGDGTCDGAAGEDCSTCEADCGECTGGCGDGVCDGANGEDCASCAADCGECPTDCAHDLCMTGGALESSCDPCATQICLVDPYCCSTAWDSICVGEVESVCGESCSGSCGDGTCSAGETCSSCEADCGACPACDHDRCEEGGQLASTCDSCVAQVCAVDSYCCTVAWDSICVGEVESVCGETCGSTCAHDRCEKGAALDPTCDPCVAQVCAADPYCCTNGWNFYCVMQVQSVCNESCVGCYHDICTTGAPMDQSCDPCVAQVCAEDPYCCTTAWNYQCVDQVESVCGQTCP